MQLDRLLRADNDRDRTFSYALNGNMLSNSGLGPYTCTQTVAKHMNEIVSRGPYSGMPARAFMNSPSLIDEILSTGKAIPDPGGIPGALRYEVTGTYRGSSGVYELVIDPATNTVSHFNFVTR